MVKHLYNIEGQNLELGAGDRPTPGYICNDMRALPGIAIVCPIEEIASYVRGRCATLRATHILEHFSWRDTTDVLAQWHGLIQPGGTIHIEVPNFEWQCRALVEGHDHHEIVNLAYGDQDHVGNYHKTGFTMRTLRKSLDDAGFVGTIVKDIGMVLVADAYSPREEHAA